MTTPPQRIVALTIGLAACYGAGRITRSTAAPVSAVTVKTASAPMLAVVASDAAAPHQRAPRNYLPAGFVPSQYDRELLGFSDEKIADFVKHGLHDEVFEQCRSSLHDPSDATCEGIYAATARVSPKFTETRKRLLSGEISAAEYQSLFHQHFLERQIALEQFMTWDDQLALDGVPPGNDMFMTLNGWGVDLPDGFKVGLENPPDEEGPPP
jgi:hypothetical protein